jgi:flavin reductase (DIM6/NTAB) family NADH-FMN oxidoreductase RutF
MEGYISITSNELVINPFKLIGKDWMLITAGSIDKFNTMTASWGGLGVLWNREVATVFVRPSRYTYEFIEREKLFTISFFEETHRKALNICGSKSGRDVDKVRETGFHPIETSKGSVSFSEAVTVIECSKLYTQDLDPSRFLEGFIEKNYNGNDYHRMYIAEIVNIFIRK